MLKTERVKYYKVKKGQSIEEIAAYFSVSPYLLAMSNGLCKPPCEGMLLQIPTEIGNGYLVREGDTKELLCGSAEEFKRLNGTEAFYIGMRVMISPV